MEVNVEQNQTSGFFLILFFLLAPDFLIAYQLTWDSPRGTVMQIIFKKMILKMCIYNYRIVTRNVEFWCLSPYWALTVLSTLRKTEVLDGEDKLIAEVWTE